MQMLRVANDEPALVSMSSSARSRRHKPAGKLNGIVQSAMSFALAFLSTVVAAQSVPKYQGPVNDNAGMLPEASRAFLAHLLSDYNANSGHQFAFLSIDSLDGSSPEAFALKVAATWRLGRAREDDGLLLLVARDARKVRIEVGYGLEGEIPDLTAKRVIDEVLTPAFRRDQFAWGLVNAFKTLMLQGQSISSDGPTLDPVAQLLEIEAPAIKTFVNDYAHRLDSADAERINANLGQIAGRYGMTFVLLTMRCPGEVQLERCTETVRALWTKRLAYYDGIIAWFEHTGSLSDASDAKNLSARLTLDRLSRSPQHAWLQGTLEHGELEAGVRDLIERAGLSWTGPQQAAATAINSRAPPSFSQTMAAQKHAGRPDTFEDKVVFGLVLSVLLGVLALFAYAVYRSRHSVGRRASDLERDNTSDLRESPVTSVYGGGRGWSSTTNSDSSASRDMAEEGGGGTFGGGGASGGW